MNKKKSVLYGLMAGVALMFSACSEGDDDPGVQPAEVETVVDVAAAGDGFTFFDLESGAILTSSDSNTVKWDIAFKGTTLLFNGGASGPGAGTAQIVDGIFDEIESAPASGFVADAEGTPAIATGSDNGWYTYTGPAGTPAHAIFPIPGKVILLTTGEGNYAKLEIISYYKGNPDTTTEEFANLATRPESQYYTFQFAVNTSGGVNF